MTDATITGHIIAAMLALEAAEKAAEGRAAGDALGKWSLAWGAVVTARGALSAAAPNFDAQAALQEPLAAGDCAEYLRICASALDTVGPQGGMPGLMVARTYVEDVVREVAAISAKR